MGLFGPKHSRYDHYYRPSRGLSWITVTCIVAIIAIVGFLIFAFYPLSDERAEKAVVLIENKSCYSIEIPGVDTLYFNSFDKKTGFGIMQYVKDSADVCRYSTGLFVSGPQLWNMCDGRVVTSLSVIKPTVPVTHINMNLKKYLRMLQTKVKGERKQVERQASEFKYYVDTHSDVDDGFAQVQLYYKLLHVRKVHLEAIDKCVTKALKTGNAKVTYNSDLRLVYNTVTSDTAYVKRYNANILATETDSELALLQTTDSVMPEGSRSCRIAPFGWFEGVEHGMFIKHTGFNVGSIEKKNVTKVKPTHVHGKLGEMVQTGIGSDGMIRNWMHDMPALNWSDGSVVCSRKGFVVGINQGDRMVEIKAVRRLMK